MKNSPLAKVQMLAVLVVFSMVAGLFVMYGSRPASASVLWFNTASDLDADYNVGYYSDVHQLIMGTSTNDPDNMLILIEPYNVTSLSFFLFGYGSISFDTNLDGLHDYIAFAPNSTLSAFSDTSRLITTGSGALTNCNSWWSMSSDYSSYAVSIPWRCLGLPTQFRVQAWLSDGSGFDFLNLNYSGSQIYYPIFPTPTTTTTTTTIYLPPPPPPTAPPVLPSNTGTPGMVDDWIKYLVVNSSVSLNAVLNTTDCCYGVKRGTRTMTVLRASKGSCVVRGRRLYAIKRGTCHVKVSARKGGKMQTEVLRLRVRAR